VHDAVLDAGRCAVLVGPARQRTVAAIYAASMPASRSASCVSAPQTVRRARGRCERNS
jgi:hypothetical protein